MDQNQEQLRAKAAHNESIQYSQADEARKAGQAQGAQAQQIAGAEQARYNAFDPEAYARAQTDAAGAMQAYQARRMGANAGKAARLGNFGLQQAQANAMGQGLAMKGQMGAQAYGMRAGQQSQLGGEALQRTGLQQGFMGIEQQAIGSQQREKEKLAEAGGNIAKGASNLLSGGALAKGGTAEAGKVHLVGEEGPELFVPEQTGTVIPANITRELSEHGKKLMKYFLEETDLKRSKK